MFKQKGKEIPMIMIALRPPIHIHIHIHIHIYIYIYIRVCRYIYIYIHTYARPFGPKTPVSTPSPAAPCGALSAVTIINDCVCSID